VATIVQKYGGSSVADLDKIARVADWVVKTRRAGHDVVVVVSAMGKTTDELLGLAQRAATLAEKPTPPARRELDMLLSVGERISMALLSIAIQARGEPAVSLTGSQSGIITNDRHFDARIIEVRPHRITDELYHGRIVIVAGYQGMSYKREITTLGRGGSDTTAVALAAALGATQCEIYSDVDGVYSADPRREADARHLPEIDYVTLQEMAESGAKVLHAKAVEFAKERGITILARKTADFALRGAGRETAVHPQAREGAAAVVTDRHVAWLSAPLARAAALLDACREAELCVRDTVLSREHAELTVPLSTVPGGRAILAELKSKIPELELRCDVGSVSVAGVGVGAEPRQLAEFMGALEGAPLLVNASPLRITAVMPEPALEASARRLHARFCAAETDTKASTP
jgi:aspartate kinase